MTPEENVAAIQKTCDAVVAVSELSDEISQDLNLATSNGNQVEIMDICRSRFSELLAAVCKAQILLDDHEKLLLAAEPKPYVFDGQNYPSTHHFAIALSHQTLDMMAELIS